MLLWTRWWRWEVDDGSKKLRKVDEERRGGAKANLRKGYRHNPRAFGIVPKVLRYVPMYLHHTTMYIQ